LAGRPLPRPFFAEELQRRKFGLSQGFKQAEPGGQRTNRESRAEIITKMSRRVAIVAARRRRYIP
jgi:hypothetical protein